MNELFAQQQTTGKKITSCFVELSIVLAAFVTTVRIFDDYYRLPTDAVLILCAVYVLIKRRMFFNEVLKIFLVLFGVLFHFFIVSIANDFQGFDFYSRLIWFLRYWFIAAVLMVILVHARADQLVRAFKVVGIMVTLVAYIFLFITIFTGFDIGVDRIILPRPHGTLSEPAHLAFLLPGLIVISIIDRKWKTVGFAFLLAVLSQSPTVYLTLAFTMILFSVSYLSPIKRRILLVSSFLFVYIIILFAFDIDMMATDNALLHSFGRLIAGFHFFKDATYSNSRGSLVFDMLEIMRDGGYIILGAGFGSGVPLAEAFNGGKTLDVTIWASFIVWFGLFGAIAFGALVFLVASKKGADIHIFWILVGALFAGSINSGGIFMQLFIILLIVIYLRSGRYSAEIRHTNPAKVAYRVPT